MGKFIGLTGNLGCGKSTVTSLFEKLGAVIIDADKLNTELLQSNSNIFNKIKNSFGPGVITQDNKVDKVALSKIVWALPEKKKELEDIMHPEIQSHARDLAHEAFSKNKRVVIFEATLIIESKFHKQLSDIIVVTCNAKVQKERFLKNEKKKNLWPYFDKIINSQMPEVEKKKHAEWIIDNSGSLEETKKQVQKIWKELLNKV
ncbi:MAG: dephospho-CoA kinase [Deltaproteobacteria bacterium]|nr:dephospho-CoA kinase [Deltaproteobacteria bacterium]